MICLFFCLPRPALDILQFCKLQDEGGVLSRVEASESDACGDESDELVGKSLSSHSQTGAHDCGFSGV